MTRPDTIISFVVDAKPVYQTQAWLLLHNLSCLDLPAGTGILLNHCGPLRPELERKAQKHGVTVQEIAAFGTGPAAYCNKLQQIQGVLASGARQAVLCDTDIGFLADPVGWTARTAVRAKTVDVSNPPQDMLAQLLDLAGMGHVPLDYLPQFRRHLNRGRTFALNCNGGLYLLPTELLRRLDPAWRKWANFCLNQAALLQDAVIHSDQLGFAMAMHELGLPFDPLDTAQNFPLHFDPASYADQANIAPMVLHYHKAMRADGTLVSPVSEGPIEAAVTRFNTLMRAAHKDVGFQALLRNSHPAVTA